MSLPRSFTEYLLRLGAQRLMGSRNISIKEVCDPRFDTNLIEPDVYGQHLVPFIHIEDVRHSHSEADCHSVRGVPYRAHRLLVVLHQMVQQPTTEEPLEMRSAEARPGSDLCSSVYRCSLLWFRVGIWMVENSDTLSGMDRTRESKDESISMWRLKRGIALDNTTDGESSAAENGGCM